MSMDLNPKKSLRKKVHMARNHPLPPLHPLDPHHPYQPNQPIRTLNNHEPHLLNFHHSHNHNHHHQHHNSARSPPLDNSFHYYLDCKTCHTRSDNPPAYYRHLISRLHTSNSLRKDSGPPTRLGNLMLQLPEFLLWGSKTNERTIVVTSLECVLNSTRLLLHFVKFGLVTDYVADPEGNFAIIQYHDVTCIQNILQDCKSTRIDSGYVRVRCKDCVSFIEWTILLDLDGTYEKSDQSFFIHHCERMSAISSGGEVRLHHQLSNFLEESSLTVGGLRTQKTIRKYLSHLLLSIFPQMCFHPLAPLLHPQFSEADNNSLPILDVYMDPLGHTRKWRNPGYLGTLGENSAPFHHSSDYQGAISRVRQVLGNSSLPVNKEYRSSSFSAAAASATPSPVDALLYNHYESGMKCRIHFDDPIAPFVSSLLELLLQLEPSLLPVLRFVHYWARVHRFVVQQNGLGVNTVLTMMVLVYFIKTNVLPSVKALQKLVKYVGKSAGSSSSASRYRYVQGWKIEFCTDLPTILDYLRRRRRDKEENVVEQEPEEPEEIENATKASSPCPIESDQENVIGTREIFTHLKNFFGTFSWVDLRAYIISPHFGELVSKSASSPGRNLPRFHPHDPLIVQHPFDLRRNIASNFDEAFVNRMQIEFRNTYRRINAVLRSGRPKMSEMFPDFQTLLRWEPFYNFSTNTAPTSASTSCSSEDSEDDSGESRG